MSFVLGPTKTCPTVRCLFGSLTQIKQLGLIDIPFSSSLPLVYIMTPTKKNITCHVNSLSDLYFIFRYPIYLSNLSSSSASLSLSPGLSASPGLACCSHRSNRPQTPLAAGYLLHQTHS